MKINWFPGHMKKALDMMRVELEKVDVIIYVLDSRAPKSSLNPKLNEIAAGKPILYVFNKIDLADEEKILKYMQQFKGENFDYVKISSILSGASNNIVQKIKSLASNKLKKYQEKGVIISIRAMVVGIPNSGKSTLVNNLCKKAKASTGDKPGVTKGKQWFNLGGVEICDTPGTLYPNLADQEIAKHLAFIGSISDDVVEVCALAKDLIDCMNELYPGRIAERFKGQTSLEGVAKVRGFVASGGELDVERAAYAVISDFRNGKLGKVMVDRL